MFLLLFLLHSLLVVIVSGTSTSTNGDHHGGGEEKMKSLLSLERQQSVEWETLSFDRLAEWYEPWELCMLYSNEPFKYFNPSSAQSCLKYQLELQKRHPKMKPPKASGRGRFFCRMGHVYHNTPCVFGSKTILSNMTHFFKSVRGHGDPRQHYLRNMLHNLAQARAAIIFMGDSTLRAFLSAMMCELERENIRYPNVTSDGFGITGTQYYTVKGDISTIRMIYKQHNEMRDRHLRNMRIYSDHFLLEHELQGVIIVIQSGTWYNNEQAFKECMTVVFAAALELAEKYAKVRKHVTLVWAEQVTQHWPTKNGYFLSGKGIGLKPLCHPLKNSSFAADWRNDIVWSSFLSDSSPWKQKLDSLYPYSRIRTLNFRALTSDMSDFHMRQQKKDCTHYCYTHMMYQPIYYQLAAITADLAGDTCKGNLIQTKNDGL